MDTEEEFEMLLIAGKREQVFGIVEIHPSLVANRRLMNQLACSATSNGNIAALQIIVDLGFDLNTFRKLSIFDGLVCLAASLGLAETTKWLIEHGCDVMPEGEGRRHSQPLVVASLNGHLDTVRILVEAGSDVNSMHAGNNALAFATTFGRTEVVKYLRSKGAKTPEELGLALPSPAPKPMKSKKK